MQPEGGMSQQQPQGIPMVQPMPVEHKTTVTGAQFPVVEEGEDGTPRTVMKSFVLVFHSTPSGTAVMVWDLDAAEKIALDIYGGARTMRSNIVLPSNGSSLQDIARAAMEKALREKGEIE